MTIYTFKLSKRKIVAFILAVAVIIAAIIMIVPGRDSAALGGKTNVQAGGAVGGIKGNSDCVEYIKSLGYEVNTEPADTRKVTIPKEFDEVYLRYNEIQKDNGFDLSEYCSKGVTLYTFYVTNYEGYSDVLLDLLVYKSRIIGGAVYTASIDGFMHGLCPNPGIS